MTRHLKDLLTGFAIGTANIIPGVSGGTFLLIFGIYERVISALNKLNGTALKEILTSMVSLLKEPGSKEKRKRFWSLLKQFEILFLIKLVGGAVFAILTLSSAIKLLLQFHQTPTYGLFFGLILASIVVPLKLFKKLKPYHIIPFIAGTAITITVANGVNPVEKITQKSEYYKIRYESGEKENTKATPLSFSGSYSAGEYLMAAVAGAVAISAMVLPGISGSLVLILLGQYFAVLTAISGAKSLMLDQLLFLGALSIGMVTGLLLFVRIVNFVFGKFYDGTVAVLTGLIAGSLFALWPFKEALSMDYYGKVNGTVQFIQNGLVYTNKNILPEASPETAITFVTILIGIAVMVPFLKHEKA